MQQPDEAPEQDAALKKILGGLRSDEDLNIQGIAPQLYDELRRLAHKKLQYQRANHTLNTTALVHEAYLKISKTKDKQWADKGHFMATATQIMRHILINYAEKRRAHKRGGGKGNISLDAIPEVIDKERAQLLLHLDEALERLADFDERGAKIVEMRFFGGFNQTEIAEMLGVTERTVYRSWVLAKSWIQKEMKQDDVSK